MPLGSWHWGWAHAEFRGKLQHRRLARQDLSRHKKNNPALAPTLALLSFEGASWGSEGSTRDAMEEGRK
ncbi:MAG: hypothetical protein ACHQAX_00945 [Gammaproteobacteria bacterium]